MSAPSLIVSLSLACISIGVPLLSGGMINRLNLKSFDLDWTQSRPWKIWKQEPRPFLSLIILAVLTSSPLKAQSLSDYSGIYPSAMPAQTSDQDSGITGRSHVTPFSPHPRATAHNTASKHRAYVRQSSSPGPIPPVRPTPTPVVMHSPEAAPVLSLAPKRPNVALARRTKHSQHSALNASSRLSMQVDVGAQHAILPPAIGITLGGGGLCIFLYLEICNHTRPLSFAKKQSILDNNPHKNPITPAKSVHKLSPDNRKQLPPFSVSLLPIRLTITFTEVQLRYKLVIASVVCDDESDRGVPSIGPIAIRAELVAATPNRLPLPIETPALISRHLILAIPPGEHIEVFGHLRMAFSAVRGIRLGDAQLFVALARITLTQQVQRLDCVSQHDFLIGPSNDTANNNSILPFSLDIIPNNWDNMAARLIS